MYLHHFGLIEPPFSLSSSPKYLYLSCQHSLIFDFMKVSLQDGGGISIFTGEPGVGKSTIISAFLAEGVPGAKVVALTDEGLSVKCFLIEICKLFDFRYTDKNDVNISFISRCIVEKVSSSAIPPRWVLIIDECQGLSFEALEMIRKISDIEFNGVKPVHIILVGQSSFDARLSTSEFQQLAQRIVRRAHLLPISRNETFAYIRFRLQAAGVARRLFSSPAMCYIHRVSGGVPRVINLLCQHALQYAYSKNKHIVNIAHVMYASSQLTITEKYRRMILIRAIVVYLFLFFLGWSTGSIFEGQLENYKRSIAMKNYNERQEVQIVELKKAIDAEFEKKTSMSNLFQQWGLDVQDATCVVAEKYHLQCLKKEMSLSTFESYGLPGVVKLKYDDREFDVVIVSINNDYANLRIAHTSWDVKRSWLESHWLNQVVLYWRPPSNFDGYVDSVINERSSDDLISWLDDSLNQVLGLPKSVNRNIGFNRELRQKIIKFQSLYGLNPNGISDVNMLILLTSKIDDDIPKLVKTPIS